jgi:hypothetical protein
MAPVPLSIAPADAPAVVEPLEPVDMVDPADPVAVLPLTVLPAFAVPLVAIPSAAPDVLAVLPAAAPAPLLGEEAPLFGDEAPLELELEPVGAPVPPRLALQAEPAASARQAPVRRTRGIISALYMRISLGPALMASSSATADMR